MSATLLQMASPGDVDWWAAALQVDTTTTPHPARGWATYACRATIADTQVQIWARQDGVS